MIRLKNKSNRILKLLAATVLISAFAITVLVGCGGEEVEQSDASQSTESSKNVESETASQNESSSAESDESSVESESSEEGSDESEENFTNVSEGDEQSENEESEVSDESVTDSESSNPDDETSSEPERVGEGTKESPYLLFPNDDMKLSTYEIAANSSEYYGIYRVGGLDLAINNDDISIVCDGKEYTPKNGKLSFRIVNAMASEAIVFKISNNSSEAQSFVIEFSNPVGTYANPVTFKTGENKSVSLEANNELGYYFKHIAEKDGTFRIKLDASKNGFLVVTNNRNSAQRSTEEDGGTNDDGSKYVDIEVQKGDELIIGAGALLNKRGECPAIDITVSGEYK